MRVFWNRVLGEIFGAKGEEVTGDWRKMRNEELRDLYGSTNIAPPIGATVPSGPGPPHCRRSARRTYHSLTTHNTHEHTTT
jgi:hypothetical protein